MNTPTKDGIYFGLPEQTYHAIERLSASGIKNLLISVPTFWHRSWMNPEKTDFDTAARVLGRAYHVAVFEPDTLAGRFVREPDWKNEYPDILATDTAVKAELKSMGATQTAGGESSLERARRLEDLGCDKPILSILEDKFAYALEGRTKLKAHEWDAIQVDIERMKSNGVVKELVTGGQSEVTILWTCPDTGIPMKARIDKLQDSIFVDLKSFANSNDKPVEQAISEQVKYLRYYISMRVYQTAIEAIKADGDDTLPIFSEAETPTQANDEKRLIAQIREREDPNKHTPWLLFQEKGGVPNILARELIFSVLPIGSAQQAAGVSAEQMAKHIKTDSILARKADMEIREAKHRYLMAMEKFGPEKPWFPLEMVGTLGDEDFSMYWLEAEMS